LKLIERFLRPRRRSGVAWGGNRGKASPSNEGAAVACWFELDSTTTDVVSGTRWCWRKPLLTSNVSASGFDLIFDVTKSAISKKRWRVRSTVRWKLESSPAAAVALSGPGTIGIKPE